LSSVVRIGPACPRRRAGEVNHEADGQAWIDMIDHRNLLSHTYDPVNFEEAVDAIHGRYLAALQQVHRLLASRRNG
jgi:uncharacterized protein with HEPN domain